MTWRCHPLHFENTTGGVVAAHNGTADPARLSECDGVWWGSAIALSPHCSPPPCRGPSIKCRIRRPMTWRRTPSSSADRGHHGQCSATNTTGPPAHIGKVLHCVMEMVWRERAEIIGVPEWDLFMMAMIDGSGHHRISIGPH